MLPEPRKVVIVQLLKLLSLYVCLLMQASFLIHYFDIPTIVPVFFSSLLVHVCVCVCVFEQITFSASSLSLNPRSINGPSSACSSQANNTGAVIHPEVCFFFSILAACWVKSRTSSMS